MRFSTLFLLPLTFVSLTATSYADKFESHGAPGQPLPAWHGKLGGSLHDAATDMRVRETSWTLAMETNLPWAMTDGGGVALLAGVTALDPAFEAELQNAGIEILYSFVNGRQQTYLVRASAMNHLELMGMDGRVIGLQPAPLAATMTGSVAGQANAGIGVDQLRTDRGIVGEGIRVGVISDTINTVVGGTITNGILTGSAPQLSGDLPPEIRVIDPGVNTAGNPIQGIDEGAAMGELIYDVAPGVELSFASAFTSYLAFAENIEALADDPGFECDVIVDDIIYFTEPVYQDGPIALAADAVKARGVSYFSAAGNFADQAHERPFTDGDPDTSSVAFPPNGVDFHDFGVANGVTSSLFIPVRLAAGEDLRVVLQWDEPFAGTFGAGPGAQADLDLYFLESETLPVTLFNIAARSTSFQGTPGNPSGEPVEFIAFRNLSLSAQTFFIAVDHFDGRTPASIFLLVAGGTLLEPQITGARSLYGHANAAGAVATGAVFYGEIDSGGALQSPADRIDPEPFSARGGLLPIFFDGNGIRLSEAEIRRKPEIVAPNGTNTTFFGADISFDADSFPNFFGTSAAAPHAAAVATLLLETKPDATPDEVLAALLASSRDVGAPGEDPIGGGGLIDAFQANQILMPENRLEGWVIFGE